MGKFILIVFAVLVGVWLIRKLFNDPEQSIQIAMNAFFDEHYECAIEKADALLKKSGFTPSQRSELFEMQADAYFQLEDHEMVKQISQKGLAEQPENASLVLNLAVVRYYDFLKNENPNAKPDPQILVDIEKAIKLGEDLGRVRIWLFDILNDFKLYAKICEYAENPKFREEMTASDFRKACYAYLEMGNTEKARKYLREMMSLDPSAVIYYDLYVVAMIHQGNIEQAFKVLDQDIEEDGKCASYYKMLFKGFVDFHQGEYSQAHSKFAKYTGAEPYEKAQRAWLKYFTASRFDTPNPVELQNLLQRYLPETREECLLEFAILEYLTGASISDSKLIEIAEEEGSCVTSEGESLAWFVIAEKHRINGDCENARKAYQACLDIDYKYCIYAEIARQEIKKLPAS